MSRYTTILGSRVFVAWLTACGFVIAGAALKARADGTETGGLRVRLLLPPAEKGKDLLSLRIDF